MQCVATITTTVGHCRLSEGLLYATSRSAQCPKCKFIIIIVNIIIIITFIVIIIVIVSLTIVSVIFPWNLIYAKP